MNKKWLILVGFTLGILISECLVRLFIPQSISQHNGLKRGAYTLPGDYQNIGHEFKVKVHVNTNGFVDSEWKQKERKRYLLIGDSFVQAAQVNLDEGLGRQLNHLFDDIEVLSLGVPGAGTTTSLMLAEAYAVDLQADGIILGFLVSNDIMNNHPLLDSKSDKPYRLLENGRLRPLQQKTVSHPPLWNVLHLLRFVYRTFDRYQQMNIIKGSPSELPTDLKLYTESEDPKWKAAWMTTDLLLLDLRTFCDLNEISLSIVLFPTQPEVDSKKWHEMIKQWPELQDESIDSVRQRAFRMASQHAPTLDLAPLMAKETSAMYYPIDGHWTPYGHAIAAKHMAPFIQNLDTSK